MLTYKALGRSIANYAAPVWSTNTSESNIGKIHRAQNEALRIITGAQKILLMTTKSLRRRSDRRLFLLLQMPGDVHPNPGPATKYPCPVCASNVTSRGVSYQCNICSGWVHTKCSGHLNAAHYRRGSDWACGPCSTPPLTPSTPPTPTPPTDKKMMTTRSRFYSSMQMELVTN